MKAMSGMTFMVLIFTVMLAGTQSDKSEVEVIERAINDAIVYSYVNTCQWPSDPLIFNKNTTANVKDITECLGFKFHKQGFLTNQTANAMSWYYEQRDNEGFLAFIDRCQHLDLNKNNILILVKCNALKMFKY
ncbi:hypothetical protein WDU94_007145 [Cyamophila willieti]